MTQFLYDGDALVAEYDGANHLLRRYLHGPGADEPLLWLEGAGTDKLRWLHADHQGSIVAVSDAAGNPLAIDSYDEYGVPGTQNQGRFQYTGQIWLPELGMYHYKARIYSPTLGRFLQTDPIGYKDQINLYAYVGDDPVNGKDPTGDFQEGTGFTDAQWKEFNKAQQQAAGDMDKKAGKLDAKADKMDAKQKGSGDVTQREASNLRAGAAVLRDTSSSAATANLVADKDWATVHPGGSPSSQGWTRDPHTVFFRNSNLGVFGSDGPGTRWITGHESIHVGAGVRDQIGPNGFPAYRNPGTPMMDSYNALRGTMQGANNPDNLMGLIYEN